MHYGDFADLTRPVVGVIGIAAQALRSRNAAV
jgi:hypothetical protein